MTSMFWGLRLEPGKRYSTTVDKSFHVSMAALDCSSVKGDEVLSVMLEEDEANVPYILCNLHKLKAMQARLDLNFMSGDRVTFFCKGNGVVHLSGYIVPDDDEFGPLGDEEGEEEEDEEDEVEEEEESAEKSEITKGAKGAGKGKMNGVQVAEKRKTDEAQLPSKKKKVEQEEADSEDSDDEEYDDMEGLDEEEEEEFGGIDEEDSNGSDEEDEESCEDEVETPAATTQTKKDKKNKQGQQTQRTSVTPNAKQQSPKTPKTANGLPTPNQQQSAKKDKKKGGESPAGTPKANKSISEDSSPQKKPLEGGVTVKDVRVGNGQVCKPGKLATVYYTGRLKNNNKVFDSAMQGPGFKFKVGKGEVIKGWDIGVNGMKVGGKRIITCPPQMAYGAKGSPPTIPGNSTLVFEVELKAVN